jgi:predicted nucleic acid-binding protein
MSGTGASRATRPRVLRAEDPGLRAAAGRAFFDTNVVLYLLSADAIKADRAESLLADGGVVSVQVLNEFAAVALRKIALDWPAIEEVLGTLRSVCEVRSLTVDTHDRGLRLARRHPLSVYDAMIAASALEAGCDTLWTEDLHDGLLIDGAVRVRNPFAD